MPETVCPMFSYTRRPTARECWSKAGALVGAGVCVSYLACSQHLHLPHWGWMRELLPQRGNAESACAVTGLQHVAHLGPARLEE